jgi:hypothetical protein
MNTDFAADGTPAAVTPEWVFAQAGLKAAGSVRWGHPVPEAGAGVYIITMPGYGVVYIGRFKHLAEHLREFRRHIYGNMKPHGGGQEILRLSDQKVIHWACTSAHVEAERIMIAAFLRQASRRPHGNQRAS